jgi:hypothetical protein
MQRLEPDVNANGNDRAEIVPPLRFSTAAKELPATSSFLFAPKSLRSNRRTSFFVTAIS